MTARKFVPKLMKRFGRRADGNVAMMFAALVLPMVVACGLAVDMFRFNDYRADLREAADAGVLAAARAKTVDPSMTVSEMEDVAKTHVLANLQSSDQYTIESFKLAFDPATGDTSLDVRTSAPTMFMGVVGKKELSFDTNPKARVVPPRDLEVVLVLDNTYSMKGPKLASLRTAAKDLVKTIMPDGADNVKVGVVPFSQYVNVGVSRRHESWIDVPDDYTVNKGEKCWNTYPDRKETNCTYTPKTCSRTVDGVYEEWSCTRKKCDVDKGEPVEKCKIKKKKYKFYGCVGSRDYPNDKFDADFSVDPVPGLMNVSCAREITPMTDKRQKVTQAIDIMVHQGNRTYIPTGLTWGYRLISPGTPFDQGMSYADMKSKDAVKAIVLMTDGANTANARYPDHWGSKPDKADDLLEEMCDEVKDHDIVLYTVAFEVADTSIRNLLKRCATTPDDYFDAKNSAALDDAFGSIALSLTELALTR
ncbi:MAG: VWA domain-containing protein [Parvularcula sp.]